MKRVPGVNTLRYQGEPRFVIVSGFNQTYNDLLIDGFSLASTDINLGQSTGGTLSNVTQTAQLGRYRWQRDVTDVYGRTDAHLGDDWRSDVGASWSRSRVDNPQTVEAFAQTRLQYAYDTIDDVPSFTPSNAAAAGNSALYPVNLHRDERYRLGEDRYDLQANLGYNARRERRGFGVTAGARFTVIRQDVSLTRTNFTGLRCACRCGRRYVVQFRVRHTDSHDRSAWRVSRHLRRASATRLTFNRPSSLTIPCSASSAKA